MYLLSSYKAIDDEIDAAVEDKHEMVDMIDGVHPCWVEGLETKREAEVMLNVHMNLEKRKEEFQWMATEKDQDYCNKDYSQVALALLLLGRIPTELCVGDSDIDPAVQAEEGKEGNDDSYYKLNILTVDLRRKKSVQVRWYYFPEKKILFDFEISLDFV